MTFTHLYHGVWVVKPYLIQISSKYQIVILPASLGLDFSPFMPVVFGEDRR